MSFATHQERASRKRNEVGYNSNDIQMGNNPTSAPTPYKVYHGETDDESPRWDVRKCSVWTIILILLGLAVVVGVAVAVAVTVTHNNKAKNAYPNYTNLSYTLVDTYSGTNFFDNFDYFTGYDPAQGFVHYVDPGGAQLYNLTYASSTSAILRVDTSVTPDSNPNASTGRFSVRLSSKNQYDTGLFVFDVVHTPTGCGTWPALWLTDPANWPYNGEIDVMEAVNVISSAENQMTLHTSSGCSMSAKRKQIGKALSSSCLNSTDNNAGCGVNTPTSLFGQDFNNAGGGIVAMELRSEGIRMWQFERSSVPTDLASGIPDPQNWGEAMADFPSTKCDIGTHFRNQSIIANIDLCGSWAGAPRVYGANCPGNCTDRVANDPASFADAYWEFGKFMVFKAS